LPFECRLLTSLSFNSDQAILFGEVINANVFDHLVIDAARGIIDTPGLNLFSAMHAARWYCSAEDRFEMERPTWKQWKEKGGV
jgi:hypothetical protein